METWRPRREYFELGRMIDAAIWSAAERYRIAFREITGNGTGLPP